MRGLVQGTGESFWVTCEPGLRETQISQCRGQKSGWTTTEAWAAGHGGPSEQPHVMGT